ncbi:dihydrodipicolinate synthase family protein [Paenibacillus filicis]|uniref:Dihydrodipicolinate synthase family protein n=1 Tax=Paenibacillus filicis TaxID=669464 RepID=A0ABU9DFP4_9BACL
MIIPQGVWPTMVTPFKADQQIDYAGLEQLIEWYLAHGVQGLFSVCLSSEMYQLSLAERVKVARFVTDQVAGRVPVVASGHISYSVEDQIDEIKQISAAGVTAFVLNTNRLARASEDDEVLKQRAAFILEQVPDVAFGLYECPVPYKRSLSPELLGWLARTGRFYFLKDTEGVPAHMKAKLEAVQGTPLRIFDAESATLLTSLEAGASGYSGIMANFHPDLYVELIKSYTVHPERAHRLQNYIGLASAMGRVLYPVGSKYYLQLEGLELLLDGRTQHKEAFTVYMQHEIEHLRRSDQDIRSQIAANSSDKLHI